jgi:hypothetical protein
MAARIRRCGRANGHTFDLPRSILGVKIIKMLGYRGGANPSQPHHSPAETGRKCSDIPI